MEPEYRKVEMTPENVHLFAYTNRADIKGDIKAILVLLKKILFII